MDKEKVVDEFKEGFESLRSEFGFSVSFEELESEFYLVDYILETGFVRENLIMQISSKIIDYFRNWGGYLNSLLIPSNTGYVGQTESKLFNTEVDKKELWDMIKLCMKFSSMYSFMFLSQSKELQAKFIDEAYYSWKNELRPYMSKVMDRVYSAWSE